MAGGLLGLLLYLSFFVLAIRYLWKSSLTFREKCLLTGLVVGYAIHNVFVFDNLASYMLFFSMLGFVHSLVAHKPFRWLERADMQSENTVIVRDYIFVPVIAILFLITLYCVNIRPLQANTRLITAMTSCSGGGTPTAELYTRALSLGQTMANQEIREQLLGCSQGIIGGSFSEDLKKSFFEVTLKEIQHQIQESPLDARIYTIAGTFMNNIANWQDGRPLLEKANELSPRKQSIMLELAVNYMNFGKEKEAAELLRKAYESAPENGTAKIGYIVTLILTGEEKKAKELFASTPEVFLDPRVVGVYAKLKQYPKVIDAYKTLIQKDPGNIQLYATLASAYVEAGQSPLAIALLESMKEKFPLAKDQIDAAIKQVREMKK